ncbi:hypothetical protein EON63_00650 [archaeon]|nr:MAG: hypothetical protein EON63_00650 [archaeon]
MMWYLYSRFVYSMPIRVHSIHVDNPIHIQLRAPSILIPIPIPITHTHTQSHSHTHTPRLQVRADPDPGARGYHGGGDGQANGPRQAGSEAEGKHREDEGGV